MNKTLTIEELKEHCIKTIRLRELMEQNKKINFESDYVYQEHKIILDLISEHENKAEHNKQIRADAIEKLKWLVIKNHCDELHCRHCDDKPRSPKNTLCALSDLEKHFDRAIEQLKENKNEIDRRRCI